MTERNRQVGTKTAERSPLLKVLGQRIASLRKARKWDRIHLARRLGVPKTRLAFWERGQCEPPLAMLLEIARVLEVSIEELAGVEPANSNNPSGAIQARIF